MRVCAAACPLLARLSPARRTEGLGPESSRARCVEGGVCADCCLDKRKGWVPASCSGASSSWQAARLPRARRGCMVPSYCAGWPVRDGSPGAAARPLRSARCTAWCPRARSGSQVELPPLRPAALPQPDTLFMRAPWVAGGSAAAAVQTLPTDPTLLLSGSRARSWVAGGAAAAAVCGAPACGRQPAAHAGAGRRAGARAARRRRPRRAGRRRVLGWRRAAVCHAHAAAADGRRGGRAGCAPGAARCRGRASEPLPACCRVWRLAAADAEDTVNK